MVLNIIKCPQSYCNIILAQIQFVHSCSLCCSPIILVNLERHSVTSCESPEKYCSYATAMQLRKSTEKIKVDTFNTTIDAKYIAKDINILKCEIFLGDLQRRNKYGRYTYRIAAYFQKVFIFGYFERAFFCENKFQRIILLRKLIPTIDSRYSSRVRSRDYFLDPARTCLSSLYRFFILYY